MNYSRKKFLYLSALGTAGFLIPRSFSGKNVRAVLSVLPSSKKIGSGNLQAALALAKEANSLRLAKSFDSAESKYREAIALVPSDIRFYDGLRKVLVVQKDKRAQVVTLYQGAYQSNPDSASFAARLADVYLQLALGNKSMARDVQLQSNISSLSDEAQRLYSSAVHLKPFNKVYPVTLNKIKLLKNNNAFTSDARKNMAMINYRKNNKKNTKTSFKNFTPSQLTAQLNKMQNQKRRVLSSLEEDQRLLVMQRKQRTLYILLVKRYRKAKDNVNAQIAAEEFYKKFPNDTKSFNLLKVMYKKNKKWNELVDICQTRYSQHPNIWAGIGLMKAFEKQYVKSGTGSINDAINLGNELLAKTTDNIPFQIKILQLIAHSYAVSQKYSNALDTLESVYSKIVGNNISDATLINQYFSDEAFYLFKMGDAINAERILKIGLSRDLSTVDNSDLMLKLLHQKTNETAAQKRIMEVTLAKIYLKSNPAKATVQLQHILSIYPGDKFATKRL